MRDQDSVADLDRGSRPDPGSLSDVAPLADFDLSTMREGHQLPADDAIIADDNSIAVATRVANARCPHQFRIRSKAARCPPHESLQIIVEVHLLNSHPGDGICLTCPLIEPAALCGSNRLDHALPSPRPQSGQFGEASPSVPISADGSSHLQTSSRPVRPPRWSGSVHPLARLDPRDEIVKLCPLRGLAVDLLHAPPAGCGDPGPLRPILQAA
ncbi:hypothetical protein ACVWW1_000599 [Bradyrhizobium sp. JR3.5]